MGNSNKRLEKDLATLIKESAQLSKGVRMPRGVFRFKTFEEADVWMVKYCMESPAKVPKLKFTKK